MTLQIDDESFDSPSICHLIDHVHSVFDSPERPHTVATLSADEWLISKLLVHEWVANLVQHAHFGDRDPEINIHFEPAGESVRYVIEDNSIGFDLDTYLATHDTVDRPLPDRGMGLLFLSSCSEEVVYRRIGNRRNRLEFVLGQWPDAVEVGIGPLAA